MHREREDIFYKKEGEERPRVSRSFVCLVVRIEANWDYTSSSVGRTITRNSNHCCCCLASDGH